MNQKQVRSLCGRWPGVTEDVKWGHDLIFSVGGGNLEKNVSPNIVAAIQEAKTRGMKVLGIVGRDGGYTKKAGDVVVVIPTVEESRVTPHAEAFQAVVWHCLVSHPKLQKNATKW